MKWSSRYFRFRILTVANVIFFCLAVISTSHAALFTISDSVTSSLGNGFQSPAIGTILDCAGDCGLEGDAVLISFVMLSTAPQYNQSIIRVYDSSGYLPVLGAGYMDGAYISPTGVSRSSLGGIELNQGVFDFTAPILNPGDSTNSLLLTYEAGTIEEGDHIQWRYQNTDGNLTGFATWYLKELHVVPLPAAVWLLGSGLIGIVGLRKKFKK